MIDRLDDIGNDVNGISARQDVASGRRENVVPRVVSMRNSPHEIIRDGTWNVGTMWRDEKLENINYETNRRGLQILRLAEEHLKDNGDFIRKHVLRKKIEQENSPFRRRCTKQVPVASTI